ncbi:MULTISPECIES: phage portal protein [unclassified Devosia]|uniref:phage portal protein n=1 Tax=unclassified Devosia TaxID=196773 RepID=UPI001AD30788|nr:MULTISPECIES: phage portal protein [unclassified Devosia]MBN9304104.1 phage portal protein [Devosia sp.]
MSNSKPRVRVQAGDAVGASARPVAHGGSARTSYAAGDLGHPSMLGWMPSSLSADAEWLRDRPISVGRMRDVERNDGWASAGIDRQVDMLVGGSLRINPKPRAAALGIDTDAAHELGRQIQSQWLAFADDPIFRSDAERELPFAGQAGLMAREFVGIGEGLAVLRWIERPGWTFRTAVQIVDPDRLSNPMGQPDTDRLRAGVEKDENNAPVAYHIRQGHPADVSSASTAAFRWDRIERWDRIGDWERPKVLHLYEKRRPGQSRGVGRLVANLVKSRMLSRYSESELRTAAINGSIVGAIYTQLGAEYAADRLGGAQPGNDWNDFNSQRAKFYGERRVLDDARFVTLFPSDRLELNTQPRQTAGYPAFQKAFLQAFAASLGLSYEQLSMDWSSTNYSSARAALNEVWRGVQRLRSILIYRFAVPLYAAWLEDALDAGVIDVPKGCADFYEAPAAWLNADWIGPARGFIDPVKEAQASTLRIRGRISTLEREAAEQGQDWEDIVAQQARENEAMRELGGVETDTSIIAPTDTLPAQQ